jgi:hypothetical protein
MMTVGRFHSSKRVKQEEQEKKRWKGGKNTTAECLLCCLNILFFGRFLLCSLCISYISHFYLIMINLIYKYRIKFFPVEKEHYLFPLICFQWQNNDSVRRCCLFLHHVTNIRKIMKNRAIYFGERKITSNRSKIFFCFCSDVRIHLVEVIKEEEHIHTQHEEFHIYFDLWMAFA